MMTWKVMGILFGGIIFGMGAGLAAPFRIGFGAFLLCAPGGALAIVAGIRLIDWHYDEMMIRRRP